jgi:hypothetical protein
MIIINHPKTQLNLSHSFRNLAVLKETRILRNKCAELHREGSAFISFLLGQSSPIENLIHLSGKARKVHQQPAYCYERH